MVVHKDVWIFLSDSMPLEYAMPVLAGATKADAAGSIAMAAKMAEWMILMIVVFGYIGFG
jgi:hypothetical protein